MYNSKLIDIKILKTAAADVARHFVGAKPFGAFVLGSGWSDAIKVFNIKAEISYADICGMGMTTIVGHAGKLSLAEVDGKEFLVFQGRKHYYEGLGWTPVVMPAYIAKVMGAELFFASNACGGINHKPGDLMIITDHINFMGSNPLQGKHHPELGPRFSDMTNVYNKDLQGIIERAGAKTAVPLVKGVYMAFWGPTYETPAEVKLAKTLGADAVGMSTVPEATVANSMGMKVAALSCITNYAAGLTGNPLSHQEVVETLDASMDKIHKILPEIVREFSKV